MSPDDASPGGGLHRLDHAERIFGEDFAVASLVLVGTLDPDGSANLVPKHTAMRLGSPERYCFACTPSHRTHANLERTGVFTASFVTPELVVVASHAAAERGPELVRHGVAALPTVRAAEIDGVLVAEAHGALECRLERIVPESEGSLIIGSIVAAHASPEAAPVHDFFRRPLVSYLTPGWLRRIVPPTTFPRREEDGVSVRPE